MLSVRCYCGAGLITSGRKSLSGRGPYGVCVYEVHGWWGGGRRKIPGHLVAMSWKIKGGSEPGGRLVLSLLSWYPSILVSGCLGKGPERARVSGKRPLNVHKDRLVTPDLASRCWLCFLSGSSSERQLLWEPSSSWNLRAGHTCSPLLPHQRSRLVVWGRGSPQYPECSL